jgi:hypothetical protein
MRAFLGLPLVSPSSIKNAVYININIYTYVSSSFIHFTRFMLSYIDIYICNRFEKKMYVTFARAMWTLITIMQMHRCYVLVINECANLLLLVYKRIVHANLIIFDSLNLPDRCIVKLRSLP